MRLFVTLDGTERFPLDGYRIAWDMDKPVATAALDVIGDASFTPAEHDAVEVDDDTGTVKFSGRIVAINRSPGGYAAKDGKYLARLTCVNNFWLLFHPPSLVTATHSATSDRLMIQDAIDQAGLAATIDDQDSNVAVIESALSASFFEATPWDVIRFVLAAGIGVISLNAADDLLYNTAANATAAAWDVDEDSQRGSSALQVVDLDYDTDHRDPGSIIDVRSEQQASGLQSIGSASDTTHGSFAKAFDVSGVNDDVTAQAIADAYKTIGFAPAKKAGYSYIDRDGSRALPLVNTLQRFDSARYGLSAETMVIRSVLLTQIDADLSLVTVTAGDHHPHASAILQRISTSSRRVSTSSGFSLLGVTLASASSEYLTIGGDASIDNLTAFTLSFWNRPTAVGSTEQTIIHKGGTNAGWRLEKLNAGGKLRFTFERATTDFTCETDAVQIVNGEIRHILVTMDSGSDVCAIFVDGTAVAITTVVGSGAYSLGSTDAFEIGRRSSSTQHYDGWIHALRFYDAILVAANIALLAALPNALKDVAASDLQLHLPLNDLAAGKLASGVAFLDLTANNNDATAIATPLAEVFEYDTQAHN